MTSFCFPGQWNFSKKKGSSLNALNLFLEANSFLRELTPTEKGEGKQNKNFLVAALESIPIHFNNWGSVNRNLYASKMSKALY